MNREIEIGRRGTATVEDDGSVRVHVEIRHWCNQPKLEQFTSYTSTRPRRADRPFRRSTGNGWDEYTLREFGIYAVRGAIARSGRVRNDFFRFGEHGLEALDAQELDAALREAFPAAAQAHDREVERRNRMYEQRKRLERAIVEQRQAFPEVRSEDGYTATPRFRDIPSDLAQREEDAEELIATFATPEAYVVTTPSLTIAEDPDEAIRQARDKEQQRRDELEAATRVAQQKAWPELIGSKKQIRWAERIRARCFETGRVSEQALRSKRQASFWIEHYKQLTR